MIPLFKVHLPESAMEPIKATLLSGYIGQGPKVEEFERALVPWVGSPNCLAVNHGTSAIRLALRLAGVGPGSEVISTPQTCLHYTSSVLLPDRSTIPIGMMVNKKIAIDVLSMNLLSGKLEPRKVIGWTKVPVTQNWYRVRCKSKKGSRGPGGKYGVFLTGDHQVLTLDGYKRVDALKPGDKVATSQRSLNASQLEVVNGMMLGDGHVMRAGKGSTRYSIIHAEDQAEWFNLGLSAFNGFDQNIRRKSAAPGHQATLTMETRRGIQWSLLREKWYSCYRGRKVVPTELPMTAATLASWYMDDGSLVRNSAILCTECFDTESFWKLFWKLSDIGLKPTAVKHGTVRGGYRISLGDGNYNGSGGGHNSAKAFFRLIAPYIPPSMRYKLPDNQDLPPFDKSLWDIGESEPMFDEAEVEERSHPDGKNSIAYCIEVEGNHNFISGDIVLKNCTASNTPILEQYADIVWGDIDPWTGNIDPQDVERKITSKTKAVIAVHWGGYPCELDELLAITRKYGIALVEDAAHAFGAMYKGRKIGSFGSFCCYSFQAIKHLTTVEGGLLVCPSVNDYRRGRLLRWYGIDRDTPRADLRCEEDIVEAGMKYNFNDPAAVLGLEQLKYVGGILAKHRENAKFFEMRLAALKRLKLLRYKKDRLSSYWLFTVRVDDRKSFQEHMKSRGVMVSQVHVRNDVHTAFKAFRRNLPGVDEFSREQVSIPVGWWVSEQEREDIALACEEWNRS